MNARSFTETLESRVLMSVALNTQVALDRLQIRADLLKFRSDCAANTAMLLGDTAAIKSDDPKHAATIIPLLKTFRQDVKTMARQLRLDRLTEAANVLADESVIVRDLRTVLADKGNKTAETADHAKLLTDRIKLQNDMIAGLNSRIATRQADDTAIFADGQAIVTAVPGRSKRQR